MDSRYSSLQPPPEAYRTDMPSLPRSPRRPGSIAGGSVIKKLAPSAAGAKRLTERYGDTLVCVRYRDDVATGMRLTTVELVVDARPLPAPAGVRIAYGEVDLRNRVKAAGGVWDAEQKLWRLPKSTIRKLKLEKRTVIENA
jgi:hypothetical protein